CSTSSSSSCSAARPSSLSGPSSTAISARPSVSSSSTAGGQRSGSASRDLMRKPQRQPEAAIQARILLALQREWPEAMWWVNKTGTAWTRDGSRPISYGLKGSSDILGCVNGRMICAEVKTPVGRQSEEQRRFEKAIQRAGGVYVLAKSEEEAVAGV